MAEAGVVLGRVLVSTAILVDHQDIGQNTGHLAMSSSLDGILLHLPPLLRVHGGKGREQHGYHVISPMHHLFKDGWRFIFKITPIHDVMMAGKTKEVEEIPMKMSIWISVGMFDTDGIPDFLSISLTQVAIITLRKHLHLAPQICMVCFQIFVVVSGTWLSLRLCIVLLLLCSLLSSRSPFPCLLLSILILFLLSLVILFCPAPRLLLLCSLKDGRSMLNSPRHPPLPLVHWQQELVP